MAGKSLATRIRAGWVIRQESGTVTRSSSKPPASTIKHGSILEWRIRQPKRSMSPSDFDVLIFGHLELNATIDDPKAYKKPWTTTVQKMHLLLDTDILEFICNENERDAVHLPGK